YAELFGPLLHVRERLGVDGNTRHAALLLLDQLRLAGKEDVAALAQVLHDRVDLLLERRGAGEPARVDRDRQVADLARLVEIFIHLVDIGTEAHAIHGAAQEIDHEGEAVTLVSVDGTSEGDSRARLVRIRRHLAIRVDSDARIEIVPLDAR